MVAGTRCSDARLRLAVHRVALARISKSTWWASNSGPSTQANWLLPSTLHAAAAAHAGAVDHDELRLTTVLIPCGRVVSATARIIGIGPIAST